MVIMSIEWKFKQMVWGLEEEFRWMQNLSFLLGWVGAGNRSGLIVECAEFVVNDHLFIHTFNQKYLWCASLVETVKLTKYAYGLLYLPDTLQLVGAGDSSWPRIHEGACPSGAKIFNRWHKTLPHMSSSCD